MEDKETRPLVSVIIPVFNTENFVRECIESILRQKLTDFELLLIDDRSTDSSYSICKEYEAKDPRVRAFLNPRKGVSSARNYGISLARGQYVNFVDSDDWVDPEYLSDFFNQPFPEGNGIVIESGAQEFADHTFLCEYYWQDRIIASDLSDAIIRFNILGNASPWGKLFERNLIISKGISFPEELSYNEDHIFVLDYLSYVDYIILSSKMRYHYIIRENIFSLTKAVRPPAVLSKTARMLLSSLEKCRISHNITDEESLKEIYFNHAIYQLWQAIIRASPRDYKLVARDFIALKPFVKRYFIYYRKRQHRELKRIMDCPHFMLPLHFAYFTFKRLIRPSHVW